MSQSESKRVPRPATATRETTTEAASPTPAIEIEAPPPQLPPPAAIKAAEPAAVFGTELFAAFTDSQAALARGAEAMTDEVAALVRDSLSLATENATAMLRARTWTDAIEANLGFARKSFDTALAGSAKVTEIGIKTASDAIHPLVSRFGETWWIPRGA